MIPTELLTMGVSVIGGGILKIMAAKTAAQEKLHDRLLQASNHDHSNRVELASAGSPGYQFTRRLIALMVIFAVMVLPKLAVLFFPETGVTYGWTTSTAGWFWGLFGGGEQLIWNTVTGIVITPLDTHVALAIAGLYFGAAIADPRK